MGAWIEHLHLMIVIACGEIIRGGFVDPPVLLFCLQSIAICPSRPVGVDLTASHDYVVEAMMVACPFKQEPIQTDTIVQYNCTTIVEVNGGGESSRRFFPSASLKCVRCICDRIRMPALLNSSNLL